MVHCHHALTTCETDFIHQVELFFHWLAACGQNPQELEPDFCQALMLAPVRNLNPTRNGPRRPPPPQNSVQSMRLFILSTLLEQCFDLPQLMLCSTRRALDLFHPFTMQTIPLLMSTNCKQSQSQS